VRHPVIENDLDEILAESLDWERFNEKRVLIAGANGMLPAYLAETLLRRNESLANEERTRVVALVRDEKKAAQRFCTYPDRDDLEILVQDVTAPLRCESPLDFIIHGASQASPKQFGTDPVGTLLPNTLGMANVLRAAHECGSERVLFISSGEVSGHLPDDRMPIKETDFAPIDPLEVRCCYAESKRMGENMAAAWLHQYGVPTVIARPFHTYGPGMNLDDGRVFADFVRDALRGGPIHLNGDGTTLRTFCYLADAARAFFTILLRGQIGEAYNVGNEDCEVSMLDLAELLASRCHGGSSTVVQRASAREMGYIKSPIRRACPDTGKLRALGWTPKIALREGFLRTLRSFA
jgi:nucleoside-diphosphate-sugar epimerase